MQGPAITVANAIAGLCMHYAAGALIDHFLSLF